MLNINCKKELIDIESDYEKLDLFDLINMSKHLEKHHKMVLKLIKYRME
jgi:hypothetical protein